MEKFLLMFCVVLSPTNMQGLLTKHKGTDILVRKVIDRLIQQHGIVEVPKKHIYTAASEDIINVGDDGGKDAFIKGIQSFIKAKRIVKRSTDDLGDIHARGTSTTPKPPAATTTPPSTMSPTTEAATTTPATTTPSTAAEKITLGSKIKFPPFNDCRKFWKSCGRSNGRRRWPFKR